MVEKKHIDRLKADLDKLLAASSLLLAALLVQAYNKEEQKKVFGNKPLSAEQLEKIPDFKDAYEAWYSEALALLKQLLPDRLQDFRGHYELPKNRKVVDYETYRIFDGLKGLQVTRPPFDEVIVDTKAAIPHLQQQISIMKAAGRRFESSLFELRQIVQADLFDTELSAARELMRNKFFRAAGAVAGVVLEKHLTQVCIDHGIAVTKKNPGINDLNDLLKSGSVIDVPQWRFVSMLGDIRNLCAHSKATEPTQMQIEDLINGTDKMLKTVF